MFAVEMPVSFQVPTALVSVPPAFSSDLKPPTLMRQGYRQALESDDVGAETERQLVDAGAIPRETVLSVGSALSCPPGFSCRKDHRRRDRRLGCVLGRHLPVHTWRQDAVAFGLIARHERIVVGPVRMEHS